MSISVIRSSLLPLILAISFRSRIALSRLPFLIRNLGVYLIKKNEQTSARIAGNSSKARIVARQFPKIQYPNPTKLFPKPHKNDTVMM